MKHGSKGIVMTAAPPLYALLGALVLGAVALGGGIYETLLVDRCWPQMPELIQPQPGGINRALFWGPVHGIFEITLLATLWLAWAERDARPWVIAALAVHIATRAWSFAYFIPLAIKFQNVDPASRPSDETRDRWVKLSRFRVLLGASVLLSWRRQSLRWWGSTARLSLYLRNAGSGFGCPVSRRSSL
jgi:hypothetical protein